MSGAGSSALQRHRNGQRLTRDEAIRAKCADCMCDFADGRGDCGIVACPLYPFMPYGRRAVRAKSSTKRCSEAPDTTPGLDSPENAPTGSPSARRTIRRGHRSEEK